MIQERKDQLFVQIDITTYTEITSKKLQRNFYKDYVKEWEGNRGLYGKDRPKKLY